MIFFTFLESALHRKMFPSSYKSFYNGFSHALLLFSVSRRTTRIRTDGRTDAVNCIMRRGRPRRLICFCPYLITGTYKIRHLAAQNFQFHHSRGKGECPPNAGVEPSAHVVTASSAWFAVSSYQHVMYARLDTIISTVTVSYTHLTLPTNREV